MWPQIPSFRFLAAWAMAGAVLAVVGALLVAWSGVIKTTASSGHWRVTEWFLELAMRSSVATHSLRVGEPPRLDDPDLVRLGAGHFAGGCAPCHGAPGQPRNPIYLQMLPEPTDLVEAVPAWKPHQLFWIVKHGIKYSGMPAWVALERDDEVWAVVAFLSALPALTPDQYRAAALGNVDQRQQTGADLKRSGPSAMSLAACGRCHDDERSPQTSRLIPSLAGQHRGYLERVLREYARGERLSGVMQPVAADLDSGEIAAVADYYSSIPARRAAASADLAGVALGRKIATEGVPEQSIPACLACHGRGTALFPRLSGQPAPFLRAQLHLWQKGGRVQSVAGRIMGPIAQRLNSDQVTAVAAFFESDDAASREIRKTGQAEPPR
ncbi:MAG TPA: c-type cytochrome [Hyphomicrobiaceae bacterium]|nr:c-type cytochrome [Hyphomicrobiaceae bacterium]